MTKEFKEFRKIRFESFMEREKIVSEYLKINPKKVIFDFEMPDPQEFQDDMKEAGLSSKYEVLYIPKYQTSEVPVTIAFNNKSELLMFCVNHGFEDYIDNILFRNFNYIEYGDLYSAFYKVSTEFKEYSTFKYQKENPNKMLFELFDIDKTESVLNIFKNSKNLPNIIYYSKVTLEDDSVVLSFDTREDILEFFKYENSRGFSYRRILDID